MKNSILIIAFLAFKLNCFSQLGIGSKTPNAESLLDFGSGSRGLVISPIPNVTTTTPTNGTIAFDGATGSIRMFSGTWSPAIAGGVTGSTNTNPDVTTQGEIIGAKSSTAQGALILEANGIRKTLVLPIVVNVIFIFNNPATGMMVYETSSQTVKVFNGNTWVSL